MLFMTKTNAGTLSANRVDDRFSKGLGFGFYNNKSVAFFECDKKTNKVRLVIIDSLAEEQGIETVHIRNASEYEAIYG